MRTTFSRLCAITAATLVAAGAAQGGIITEIDPFVGGLTETWEGFDNYNEGNFFLDNPTEIMGGGASISNPFMVVYEPGPAGFGLGTSGLAQVSDGTKGMGVNAGGQTVVITFDIPILSYGAYWGAATRSGFPDPNTVGVSFYTPGGSLIDAIEFEYSHSDSGDGGLDWHGWSSTTAIGRVEFNGDFIVTDGLQADLVPAPGAMALLGLAGLFGTRRRRRA